MMGGKTSRSSLMPFIDPAVKVILVTLGGNPIQQHTTESAEFQATPAEIASRHSFLLAINLQLPIEFGKYKEGKVTRRISLHQEHNAQGVRSKYKEETNKKHQRGVHTGFLARGGGGEEWRCAPKNLRCHAHF